MSTGFDTQIKVEGTDIRQLDLKAFRAQMGCVQQEPILFEGTVSENIRLGKMDATQEEIEEAAKAANAHDFILQLPNGYETKLAERGGGMSGGQKQRIAIARALISKPKLLLLDEATSALDTRSERIVQEALERASTGRTCVVVAHRLSTIRNADLILVLKNGVIWESGNHDELVAKNGLYATMLSNQNNLKYIFANIYRSKHRYAGN
ncbi:ABC transporter, ATP-binding protein [Opisthorchis viverrini]|uniref:ABC transporter, ATP-binding protein n=1 Tax=Opisthorchis viverrini TaxID=6198 RepID=A0A1S8X524_OPIVI|nr:ABC transporter, ATP-binding protein [Opisthorchis viverrini]